VRFLALAFLPWSLALAQAASSTATFRGEVIADSTFEPLAGAEVRIVELQRATRSGETGAFEIGDLPAGVYTIAVRMVGYQPREVRVAFTAGNVLERDFPLVRIATTLPTVPVRASADPVVVTLADFERRRSTSIGHFMTPEQLEKVKNRKMQDVLRAIPGIKIMRDTRSGAYWAISGRGSMSFRNGARCFVSVYFDGQPIFTAGRGQEPPDLDKIFVLELAAIEFYAGGAQIPIELNATGTACGVLVLWSKRG
jgi:hypothetical protein